MAYAQGDTDVQRVVRDGGRAHRRRALAGASTRAPQARDEYERYDSRRRDFRALTLRATATALDALYRSRASDADKRAAQGRR